MSSRRPPASLCQLFQESRDPRAPVARRLDPGGRVDRVVRWEEFRRQVADLRDRLAGGPEGAWVLLTEDAYAFAVGLLALWQAGRHAISPPNRQPRSLRALETRAAGVVSDRPDWFPEDTCLHPLADGAGGDPASLGRLQRDAPAVELYTSGTTGAEKPVTKRIRHLDDEVRELSAAWDAEVADATVFSTASHQHLYGLMFGVLWPLCAGHCFQADHFLHVGELAPRMREAGSCVLASVPTHLKRLGRHAETSTLRDPCRIVFSSGGPLPAETAHRVAAVLGRAPIEVLGSTETGVIAWRTQEPGARDDAWTPFPAVRVTRDPESGVARVSSPFVSVGEGDTGFATGDRVALGADGRFRLEGRADRVVKVGEKRLDLQPMESCLRAHAWVAEAALTTVLREGEVRMAAAVVPTEPGWAQLRRLGRRALLSDLARALGEDWDPVLHPRHWRVVSRLPENAQGKLTADALRRLFEEPAREAEEREVPAADRPEVLEETRGDHFLERVCAVPRELSCLPGHFPDAPVVPGVLQLGWALDAVAELEGRPAQVESIDSLKLLTPLRPGQRFRLRVRVGPDARVDFRIWEGDCEHAKGRVRVARTGRRP